MNRTISVYTAQLLLIGLISIPSSIYSSTLQENNMHQRKMSQAFQCVSKVFTTVATKQNALIAISIGAAWYINGLQKQVATLQKNQKDTVLAMRLLTGIVDDLLKDKSINTQQKKSKINIIFDLLDGIAPAS